MSITSTIYESFEKYEETRAVFLDISKAFDKVWHDGLLFKLRRNFFGNYLSNRYQRVVLNEKESNWINIESGVPQGSVLGPLLFLVFINDLPENLLSTMKLFTDDSSIFTQVTDVTQTQTF